MLCDYGCGQEALYQFKNGKWCCSKSWMKCSNSRNKKREDMKINNPLFNLVNKEKHKFSVSNEKEKERKREYAKKNNPMFLDDVKNKHKLKMKELFVKNNPLYTSEHGLENLRNAEKSIECREKKRESALLSFLEGRHPMCFEENKIKVSISNSKDYKELIDYINYNKKVTQLTARNLIKNKKNINNYNLRGRKFGYELDHKYSIYMGFINKIEPERIAHWKNLEIISKIDNGRKYTKCSITKEELLLITEEE